MNEVLTTVTIYILSGLFLAIQDLKHRHIHAYLFYVWMFIQTVLVISSIKISCILIMTATGLLLHGYNIIRQIKTIQTADIIFLVLSGMILPEQAIPFFFFNFFWISIFYILIEKGKHHFTRKVANTKELPFISICYINTILSLFFKFFFSFYEA